MLFAELQVLRTCLTLFCSLLDGAFRRPRKGKNNDKAHPPIHPTKLATDLTGDDQRVYEFVTRRFLAACSDDAHGQKTTVDALIGDEKFTAVGMT